jgi:hypothetical protein
VILLILGLEFFLVYIVLTGVTSAPVLSCALSLEPAFCDPRPSTPSGLQLGACRFCLQGALGRAGQAEKLPWQCSSPPNPQSSLWLPSSLDHLPPFRDATSWLPQRSGSQLRAPQWSISVVTVPSSLVSSSSVKSPLRSMIPWATLPFRASTPSQLLPHTASPGCVC